VSTAYVAEAEQYHQTLVDNHDTLCAEMSDADCERLEMLARALWVGGFGCSSLMSTASNAEFGEFLATREQLIYYNYRARIQTETELVYAHMGLAHTHKGEGGTGFMSAGGRLALEYPLTEGLVYTTRPDNGPGSKVNYWGNIETVAPEYPEIAEALASAPFGAYAVSTLQPGQGCVGNPVATMPEDGDPCGQAYDSIVFVRLITPDDGAPLTRSAHHAQARRIGENRRAVRELERRFLMPALPDFRAP
jgi:hypothetical protein